MNQVADDNRSEFSSLEGEKNSPMNESAKKANCEQLVASDPMGLDPRLTRMPSPGTTPTEHEVKAFARRETGNSVLLESILERS